MKKIAFYIQASLFVLVACMTSCTKQLDQKPTNDITAANVYSTSAGY